MDNNHVRGILISRFPASYENAGGRIAGIPRYDESYINWLKSLIINGSNLTEEEVDMIYQYTQERKCGKFEFEQSAKEWLRGA